VNRERLLPLFILICSFLVGLQLGLNSLDGKATARLYQLGRVVAGSNQPVKKPILMDAKLTQVENIIGSLSVVRQENLGVIGLRFGNYISEYGQNLCSAFNKIELILFGDGVATSGEHPRLIFTGYCPIDPSPQILSNKVKGVFPLFLIEDCQSNTKFIDQIELSNGTNIKVTNMDVGVSEPDWVIEKLSFIDENNPLNVIEFNFDDIADILKNKTPKTNQEKVTVICD
jgi:hypothetical protein